MIGGDAHERTLTEERKEEMGASPRQSLVFGTLSFAICFAAWGLVSASAPYLRSTFGLTGFTTALIVAVPVLLGALARLPLGILADRLGGRLVFTTLIVIAAGPAILLSRAHTFTVLILAAFFLGLAGSSFAVGVSFVSRWTPPDRQGAALGIFGLGNIGQSLVVMLGPLLAASIGWPKVFQGMAVLLVCWGAVFGLLARNAPRAGAPKGLGAALAILRREPLAWVLSLFYFLTFGGFVAFAIYLPTLLRDQFGLSPQNAGLRAAGFVALATGLRPVGGSLADRIGGARVLGGVFAGVVPFALLLAWPAMIPFTVGALGCAAMMGLGNGAVFKLVPEYFPRDTGTVTGLVGAMGGLGGFFPPLLLGFFRDRVGAVWPGFLLLAASALALSVVNRRVFVQRQLAAEWSLPQELRQHAERLRAGSWATLVTALLAASVVVGSRRLRNFDAALVVYTFGILFAAWGVAYRYWIWLQKPPTRRFWTRGWQLFLRQGLAASLVRVTRLAGSHLLGQTFIHRRSPLRWWAHQLIFWGCILAAAITFPLVFGWIFFGTPPDGAPVYITYVFGFAIASFRLGTPLAWVIFHGLDIAAVLVLAGISLALARRLRERGALVLQTSGRDLSPLILLFAISTTGLALTVSTLLMRGVYYQFLALLHAMTVIAALLYLPFGKFFHIFQRPAQLGVKLYQAAGERDEGASCARCGQRFSSRMHIDDLRDVLQQLGFNYELDGGATHWQAICPSCKRRSVWATQLHVMRNASKGSP
jgi:NNP family nitrate/nitrite transporter-like MFS transporter